MRGVVLCFILTLIQMVTYISLLEVFSETRRWFAKYKILAIITITIICTIFACTLESWFYIKIATTILLYLLIAIITLDAQINVAGALAMVYFNLAICLEYLLSVVVLNVDSLIPGTNQGNADMLQMIIVTIEEIILVMIITLCIKNKGKLKEIQSLLQTKDWLGIFIMMIFSALILIVSAKQSGIYHIDSYGSIIGIAIAFMNIAIIHLFVQSTKRQKHILESTAILSRVQNEIALYKSISDSVDKQRKRVHEFDNQLYAIKCMATQGNIKELQEYINDIHEKMPKLQQEIDTKHVIINAILNAKNSEMQRDNILFVTKYNDLSGITVADDDLVVLLSNLLNNAVEASSKSKEKTIKMKFVIDDNQVVLSIKNSIAELPEQKDGTFITTKTGEPSEHGIGLKNVVEVINKYNGSYVIDFNDTVFSVSMIIPL